MYNFLRASLGWVLVAIFLTGAMVVEWDNWGARRTIERIQNWRGWQGMRNFSARVLRKLAENLEKKPPPPEIAGPRRRSGSGSTGGRRRGIGRRPVRTESAPSNQTRRERERRAVYERWARETENTLDRLVERRQSRRR